MPVFLISEHLYSLNVFFISYDKSAKLQNKISVSLNVERIMLVVGSTGWNSIGMLTFLVSKQMSKYGIRMIVKRLKKCLVDKWMLIMCCHFNILK